MAINGQMVERVKGSKGSKRSKRSKPLCQVRPSRCCADHDAIPDVPDPESNPGLRVRLIVVVISMTTDRPRSVEREEREGDTILFSALMN